MNIEYWRTEIDEIDRELLRLLNRRARLAMKVGALKNAAGLPCCDPERERVVLNQLQQANPGPLAHHAVTKVFRRIIRESRQIEMLGEDAQDRERRKRDKSKKERQTVVRADPIASRPHESLTGEGVLV
jgi:chorismate mutase-like protein